jgi:DNA recombination protein RmuC
MEIILGIALGVLLLINGILVWVLTRPKKEAAPDGGMLLLQNQLNELTKTIDFKLTDASKSMADSVRVQFSESAKIIKEVTEGLTKLDETNRQVVSFADQLQGLQDILKNPKQRGVLGEYYLQTVLENVMPPGSFQMQYAFPNGEIVDAVVFVKDKIIPIDSKFSLENYNRILEERNPAEREKLEKLFKQDLKNRIDETSKYVRPSESTMDFAFMFIPSEGIYYDLLINQIGAVKTSTRDLIEYAFTKKVIIVSPTSFLAYLQTVLQGLRGLQIEESAKEIRKRVEELGRHLLNYEEYHSKMGKALEVTVSHFNTSRKELGKIDKDVLRITGEAVGIPALSIDKPEEE